MISLISRTYWPATMGGAEKYFFEIKKRLKNSLVYTWDNCKEKGVIKINIPKVRLIGSAVFSYKVSKMINNDKSKLVHINQFWSEYSSFFLKKPFVSTIYDLPNNVFHKTIIKNCALKSKAVFYISELVKKQLISYGVKEESLFYAPPGINRIKYKKKRRSDDLILLHISRIAPNKDLITIIKALSLIKKKISFKFYVIGQRMEWTNYYKKIAYEIKKNKLNNNIKLLGKVSENKKNDLLNRADIYLHASTYGEGFGIPIIEAQSCGTPVIASKLFSDLGIIKDKYNGLIFPNKDYKELSRLILTLINDNHLRKVLNHNGKITSKKFNWNKTVNTIKKVYKTLL